MANNRLFTLTGYEFNCILFDFGNTLWHRDERMLELELAVILQTGRLLRRYDTLTKLSDDDLTLGELIRDAMYRQFHLVMEKDPGSEPPGPQMVRQALHELGLPEEDEETCTAIFEALRVRIPLSRHLFPDSLSTLQELQRRALQLGVVTNRYWGGTPFQEDMQQMGLLDYFEPDKVIISADEHIRKPNPRIFELALAAWGADKSSAMMIGDSLIADVAGAQQVPIFAVWKPMEYAEVSQYLAEIEGISVAEYNRQQLALLKERGTIEPPEIPPFRWDETDLHRFAQGKIRPQLIINEVKELLDWL